MPAKRFYDANANEQGTFIPGVPLRDLTDEEYDALPKYMQATVDASPFYKKSKPRPPAPEGDASTKVAVTVKPANTTPIDAPVEVADAGGDKPKPNKAEDPDKGKEV